MTDTEIVERVLHAADGTCIAISMVFQMGSENQPTIICYWVSGSVAPDGMVDVRVQDSLLMYRETVEISSTTVAVCGTRLGLFALVYGRVIYKVDTLWQRLREAGSKVVALPTVDNETLDARVFFLKVRAALGRARATKGLTSKFSLISVINSYSIIAAALNNCRIVSAGDIVVQLESIDMRCASVIKLALAKLVANDVDGAVSVLHSAVDELEQISPPHIAMLDAL